MENYDSLGVIGEGTYGVVIKARHKESGQIVAIKKFKESDEDEQVRKTSLREVRVLKQLRHENIVSLLEVFRRKGKLYLVFEYIEKTILEVLEKKPNGLDEIEVKKYMYQLLRGIEYCHTHNVIHRDIKPENILISKNGALKICDFGFARTMSVGGKYTDYVATRWYRGPELLVGDVEYGKGVDVWAVGCIFAEVSNGMPLFPGESDLDQLNIIMRCFGKLTQRQIQIFRRNPLYVGVELPNPREIEPLEMKFPNAPKNWLAFLKACLKNDPDQRETSTSLLSHVYFTDRGFKTDYENELRLLMDREARSNHWIRKPGDSAGGMSSGSLGPNEPPPTTGTPAPPANVVSPNDYAPALIPPQSKRKDVLLEPTMFPATQTSSGAASGAIPSLWSQYLASSGANSASGGPSSSTPEALPELSMHHTPQTNNSLAPLGVKSNVPSVPLNSSVEKHHYTTKATTGLPYPLLGQQTGGSMGGGPGMHHSYASTMQTPEPMIVTGARRDPPPQATGTLNNSKAVKPQQHTLSFPALGNAGSLGASSYATSGLGAGPHLPSTVSPPTGNNSSNNPASLTYKKKPQKRSVLSTLNLTAFGTAPNLPTGAAQQSNGSVHTTANPYVTEYSTMMLHGQSHGTTDAYVSRRTSK